ncbi:bifunctional metallophosphatase/5'-nucleotidase [Actinacidiphila bryophytorum]|uniref:bifunctional metallophosphatase/5'-nucleotidase n=1 Tax=Actinacidiphila bryophytorum TaxID=1436133 RepID=UPI0019609AB3|nr:bifunctional metallophosphatase/5'-nucleotidase [Actinacidiphila bryophytorum]MBM9438041.1 bifunctional metallophosphatase/5'-nucleotidase [Actinacidiphila bryophytorum]MBN6541657.1 bifunctional metallophosphatase/5'-nucleotidase [Actinacidiphila bryophytorum]
MHPHARKVPRRSVLASGAAVAVTAAVGTAARATPAAADAPSASGYVDVQLLSITDLHGYVAPPGASEGGTIPDPAGGAPTVTGGAAYLATHLKRLREGRANSLFFSAGDNFAGWAYYADVLNNESTIEVLNAMGLRFSSLGNHELDKGMDFTMNHMVRGRHYPYDAPFESFPLSTGRRFKGADWTYYSGNVVRTADGGQVLPSWNIEYVQAPGGRRLPVGFIHMTVEGAVAGPGFNCSYQPTLTTTDLVDSANRSAAELKARGVNALVVVMHEGGYAGDDYNAGSSPTGPAFDLAAKADPDIGVIVTGHWHCRFNMMVDDPNGVPRPVVEAGYYGQLLNETTIRLDARTGRIVRELTTSTNHAVTRDVPQDPEVADIVAYWTGKAAALDATPLARQTGDLTRAANASGESTLGNLVADFLVWDSTQYAEKGAARAPRPADLAVFPSKPPKARSALGGDLPYAKGAAAGDADGVILFGEAWKAYGFDSPNMSATYTGAAVHQALEQQWQTRADGSVGFFPLAVSDEVRYVYDTSQPVGSRVDPAKITVKGKPLDLEGSYRLATNAYTMLAYDGYDALTTYTDPVRHTLDHEGFVRYLRTRETVTPPPLNRATPA